MKYYIINTIPVNNTFEDKRFMSYKKGSDFLKRDNVIKKPMCHIAHMKNSS